MKVNKEIFGLILLLILACIIRVYSLGYSPFWIDEAISSHATQMILTKWVPVFDSGAFYSRALIFHYIQALFLLVKTSDFWARLPSVIFGLATIILGYKIGKEYSKSGGIITALFFSFFFLEVFFSRQARFYQLFQLLFFATIYCLYKSKENKRFLYAALILLLITINTQIQGIVLLPFFMYYIIKTKQKYAWAFLLLLIPLGLFTLRYVDFSLFLTNLKAYAAFLKNSWFLFLFALPSVYWSWKKKPGLTMLLVLPAVILFLSVCCANVFALRYIYIIIFPLLIFSALFFVYLSNRFGKGFYVLLLIVILFTSNIVIDQNPTFIIKPVKGQLNDYTAPIIDYKNLPEDLKKELQENTLIVYFSPSASWYLRQPNYVIPFSLSGLKDDEISHNSSKGLVDVYSGAQIVTEAPKKPFYLAESTFAHEKLTGSQKIIEQKIIQGCEKRYTSNSITIYYCKN